MLYRGAYGWGGLLGERLEAGDGVYGELEGSDVVGAGVADAETHEVVAALGRDADLLLVLKLGMKAGAMEGRKVIRFHHLLDVVDLGVDEKPVGVIDTGHELHGGTLVSRRVPCSLGR